MGGPERPRSRGPQVRSPHEPIEARVLESALFGFVTRIPFGRAHFDTAAGPPYITGSQRKLLQRRAHMDSSLQIPQLALLTGRKWQSVPTTLPENVTAGT